ncbi:MAG: endolytic transglycosylase MltG [Candidatus Pacebacteria bacterium]|nr:endolytic transglycosylase MltG [Candidatus Paceibacterota bacterium]
MDITPPVHPNINQKTKIRAYIIICLIFVFTFTVFSLISAPFGYAPTIIHISRGANLKSITEELKEKNVVRSASMLQTFVLLFQSGKAISVGDYYFNGEPVWRVGYMLAHGDHHIVPIRVTFPEGLTTEEMSNVLAKKIPSFDTEEFLRITNGQQGYLFPDTYFFYPKTTADEVVDVLQSNFAKKIKAFDSDIEKSGYTKKQILTMASILEGEARGENDINIISGILWKRLKNGMLLQVDVDRGTYSKKGLPSSPIANPGISAIKAALEPSNSPYLYYLHDKDGRVHYAVTYTEHKNNIKKYLK